jgi:hypothetical protein
MSTDRTVTKPQLVEMRRGELARVYESGTADTVPDGRGRGTVLLGTGGAVGRVAAVLAYLLAWRGKVFDRRAGRLSNLITPLAVRAISADVYRADSWHDGRPCIVLDYAARSFVARKIRDEIREVAPGVFLGLVYWGRRHILDFALDFNRR